MHFCFMNDIGTKGEVCRQLNTFLNRPGVYATDRSEGGGHGVVLILCGFVVYTTGRFMF